MVYSRCQGLDIGLGQSEVKKVIILKSLDSLWRIHSCLCGEDKAGTEKSEGGKRE
jgi:hypothetical protein